MTTTQDKRPVSEPTGWLRATGAAQARRLERLGLTLRGNAGRVIVAPLVNRPDYADRDRWERTCDRCGRYCPEPEPFYVFRFSPATRVALFGGLCTQHAQAEGVAL